MICDWDSFENKAYRIMVDHSIPGAAVAVAKNGKTVYAHGFGHRNRIDASPVNPDTVFGIASITKSFTAMAVMRLFDKGLLRLDDAVTAYVPEFRPNCAAPDRIKISHLLSHTAGLPPLLGISYDDEPGLPNELTDSEGLLSSKALEHYLKNVNSRDYQVYGRPGEYFSYSNPGFVLLGAIVERVAKLPFYDYIENHILRPLGMSRTTFGLDALRNMNNVTRLYKNTLDGSTEPVASWPDVRLFGASGGLKSSANDLIRYASVYAQTGVCNRTRLLSLDSLGRMTTPVYRIDRASHYGFALQITPDYSGYTLCEHGGSLPGVSSTFGFVPEAGLAAVVLTNVQNAPANDLWLCAINTALGLPLGNRRFTEPVWDAPVDHFDRFLDRYQSAEGADIRITKDKSLAYIELPGEKYPLRATAPDYAVFSQRGQQRLIRFFDKATGGVLGMFYGTSMSGIRLIKKVE